MLTSLWLLAFALISLLHCYCQLIQLYLTCYMLFRIECFDFAAPIRSLLVLYCLYLAIYTYSLVASHF
ncbi:uncharacterized protein EI90DRAFT_3093771 [Cantharellus anzutake]|uniref:uncharacterized protein n=1 Tax=Cantharellus anzutake TaxID=1750568 RepID=UPI001907B0E9|nr:uncharacterized protein EI90DRAFT_3093771 [Cantharellus anzutake]KAF8312413.1 hypothetical protein EI90DRAFT_3093771 [Cantharellus anzutake]